jgi:hypothetical protein
MSLYTRLMGLSEPQIPAHSWMAALGELERGKLTNQQVIDIFGLNAGEQTEALDLISKIMPPREALSLGGRTTLTNIGSTYLVLAAARIECAGINAFEFACRVQKIGTGTQSWQLWDATNGVELVVFNDTNGAGERDLGPTVSSFAPLAPGFRTLHVRGKSTTAADDPIFIGATLMIQRIGLMNADVLHQILLLASNKYPPLDTEAALKTRLGVT